MVEESQQVPAVPPQDYEGTMADWLTELRTRGIWDGEGDFTGIMIPTEEWKDVLKTCEQ